jgi:hypothetical protein
MAKVDDVINSVVVLQHGLHVVYSQSFEKGALQVSA